MISIYWEGTTLIWTNRASCDCHFEDEWNSWPGRLAMDLCKFSVRLWPIQWPSLTRLSLVLDSRRYCHCYYRLPSCVDFAWRSGKGVVFHGRGESICRWLFNLFFQLDHPSRLKKNWRVQLNDSGWMIQEFPMLVLKLVQNMTTML